MLKKELNNYFIEENFILTNDNLKDTIFINDIDGVLYGIDGEFETFRNNRTRGRDHNSVLCNFEDYDFDNLIKEVAILEPETLKAFYNGNSKKTKSVLKKLGYKIEN